MLPVLHIRELGFKLTQFQIQRWGIARHSRLMPSFFDQSLSEVKILQMLNANDPDDARCILRLRAFFYHRERPIRSKRLAPPGARTVGPRPRLAPRERARRPLRSEARHGLVRSAHPLAPLQGRGVQP